MQSGYHNLPVINGRDQKEGSTYKAKNSAFMANEKSATFSTDISGAYMEDVKVRSWVRSYYWPNGVTRVRLEFIKPALKGGQSVTFTKVNT